jgi:hypothetical protein
MLACVARDALLHLLRSPARGLMTALVLCVHRLTVANSYVLSMFACVVSCCAAAWQGPTQEEWDQQQQQLLEQQQLVADLQQQLAGMQVQHSLEQQGLKDANLALQASDTGCMPRRSLATPFTGPHGDIGSLNVEYPCRMVQACSYPSSSL